jgi:hypothetical protein
MACTLYTFAGGAWLAAAAGLTSRPRHFFSPLTRRASEFCTEQVRNPALHGWISGLECGAAAQLRQGGALI